jgi:hypothetical protein
MGGGSSCTNGFLWGLAVGSLGVSETVKDLRTRGCSKDKNAVINATNTIISTSILKTITDCEGSLHVEQNIEIKCDPETIDNNTVYEANGGCTGCLSDTFNSMTQHHAAERRMWTTKKKTKVRLSINDELEILNQSIISCGIFSCKACTLMNVTQSSVVQNDKGNGQNNSQLTCNDKITDQAGFKLNLQTALQQSLTNNQDVLAGIAQQFSDGTGGNISQILTNEISSRISSTKLNEIKSAIESSQDITLTSESSAFLNNVSQSTAYNIILRNISELNIATQIIQESTFKSIENIVNNQNTLNEIGEAVFESVTTFGEAIDNTAGKIMIASMASLGLLVLIIFIYAIRRFVEQQLVTVSKLSGGSSGWYGLKKRGDVVF